MNLLTYIGLAVILLLVAFAVNPQVKVCTYSGQTYNNVYEANQEGKWIQSFGACVQSDVVTIPSGSSINNPVEKSSFVVNIGAFLFQLASYPLYWTVA